MPVILKPPNDAALRVGSAAEARGWGDRGGRSNWGTADAEHASRAECQGKQPKYPQGEEPRNKELKKQEVRRDRWATPIALAPAPSYLDIPCWIFCGSALCAGGDQTRFYFCRISKTRRTVGCQHVGVEHEAQRSGTRSVGTSALAEPVAPCSCFWRSCLRGRVTYQPIRHRAYTRR